jgi:hypothetical protein
MFPATLGTAAHTTEESAMITYRPIPPLTLGKSNSWRSVLAAVVMAALLGTAAFDDGSTETSPRHSASSDAGASPDAGATAGEAGPGSY